MRLYAVLGCGLAALVFGAGCEAQYWDAYSCTAPAWGNPWTPYVPGKDITNPCPKAPKCPGECVPLGPDGFRREPVLVWMGEESAAPECPEHARGLFYEGHDGLVAPHDCDVCTCGPSPCVLPTGVVVHDAAGCQGSGPVPFDAPAGWEGACTSPTTIAPGGVASLSIAPPTVGACEVIATPKPPAFGGPHWWTTFARACQGHVNGECDRSDQICNPTALPPPPGFRQCIKFDRAVDEFSGCPADYPEQFTFYKGLKDTRACTACECGAPSGNSCVATVSAYQDVMCGAVPVPLFKDYAIGEGAAVCVDVMGGVGLGAISAAWAVNEPGACVPSGGEALGEVVPEKPGIFCCEGMGASE